MAERIEISIDQKSLQETYDKILQLGKKTAKKYARQSAAAGGRIIRDKARARAISMGLGDRGIRITDGGHKIERTGRIPKNIVAKTLRMRGGEARAIVTWRTLSRPDQGAISERGKMVKKDRKNAWYARFVELGNPATGMPARPFLRQGAADGAQAAIEAAQKVIADGFDKEQAILALSNVRYFK